MDVTWNRGDSDVMEKHNDKGSYNNSNLFIEHNEH